MSIRRCLALACSFALLAFSALAETASLLILHTNDLHDHLRPGYEGLGGLPYVSGYVQQVRAERKDVLLLDAGDVMEKGDMLAFTTESLMMYEALGKIGYAAVAIGNHDADHGFKYLRSVQTHVPNIALLCMNWRDKENTPYLPASKVFEVNGVKVGVIGMTVPKGGEFMSIEVCGRALEEEAERLKPETHLQVLVGHLGSKDAEKLSGMAPEIDVVVSGHTHELLEQPLIAKKNGAIIVQAGNYAQHVGRLELSVDLEAKKIVQSKGEVVAMRHDAVPCDQAMAGWVREREQALCPDAARIAGRCDKPVSAPAMARLAAEALLKRSGADIAFCHAGTIIRSGLPKGDIDVNALFVTGGQRGRTILSVEITGKDLETYLLNLMKESKGLTQYAGIMAKSKRSGKDDTWSIKTNLKEGKTYRVVIPELEWKNRFLRVVKNPAASWNPSPCDFTFTDAVTAYVDKLTKSGGTIDAEAERLDK